ncbi:MAG TPA: pyridoxal-phosphate dependent enzyme [Terriglobales bacterium]|nr:pyridoxal-phosphate dependent enzyme [Terriglobales bacterium]
MDLNLANIERAARVIDPVFRNSPQFMDDQLNAALGRRTVVKVETANPIRSFKGRGADFFIHGFDRKQKVVCASAGNFGQAIAYSGRSRGIAVEVFVSTDANPMKIARMRSFGAVVTPMGEDFDTAKAHARARAAEQSNCIFVEDGDDPAISEGAGTIGIELLTMSGIDTIVLPLGDGALITGVAMWVKAHSPRTKIIGVCAAGAAAMLASWQAGKAIPLDTADTIADGIAVRIPVAASVERMKTLVDDIVLVDDLQLLEAMRISASTLGLLLEPAGAAGLAAIRAHQLPGNQLATVLTGSNVHPGLLAKVLA